MSTTPLKKTLVVTVTISLLIGAGFALVIPKLSRPQNRDECVLAGINEAQTDQAARLLAVTCGRLYPVEPTPTSAPWEREYPTSSIDPATFDSLRQALFLDSDLAWSDVQELTDVELVDRVYQQFYSDMTREEFDRRLAERQVTR